MHLGNGQFRALPVPCFCVYFDSRSTSVTESLHGTSFVSLPITQAHFRSEACIKGHRSSSCQHADRPLFEIKKKGRPVSQCEKCRQLRQSKKVHTKCICNPKFDQPEQRIPLASNGTKCDLFHHSRKYRFFNGFYSKEIYPGGTIITKWPEGFDPRVRFIRGLS
jgi:hypothetical protein